jgi:hypothetical protein
VLVGAWAGVRAREDRGGGLTAELVHRELRVGPAAECVCAVLDERLDERAVLVQRRPVEGGVLLEGERQLGAALELHKECAERTEREGPEGRIQLWSTHDHDFDYAVLGSSPVWHRGHQ